MLSAILATCLFLAVSVSGVEEIYDASKRVCCGGELHDFTDYMLSNPLINHYNAHHYCCGTQVYNINTSVCCDDERVIEHPDKQCGKIYKCCGDTVYELPGVRNPSDPVLVCCKGCGKFYDQDKHFCCGPNLIERNETSKYFACCGDDLIDPRHRVCSDLKDPLGHRTQPEEGGGKKVYSVDRTIFKKEERCCGESTYLGTHQICCNGKLARRQGRTYHSAFSSSPMFYKKECRDLCCGDEAYEDCNQVCRKNDDGTHEVVNKFQLRRDHNNSDSLCGNTPFDSSKKTCCNNVLSDVDPKGSIYSMCCKKHSTLFLYKY